MIPPPFALRSGMRQGIFLIPDDRACFWSEMTLVELPLRVRHDLSQLIVHPPKINGSFLENAATF